MADMNSIIGMPAVPIAGSPNQSGDFESKAASISSQTEGANQRIIDAMKSRNEAVSPVRQQLMSKYREGGPEVPKPVSIPEAPKSPVIDPKEMNDTLSLITVLSMLGGAASRQKFTAALGNFSAGVQGYVQGNQNVFQNNLKEFDANVKSANEKNNQIWKEYEAASKKHGMDIKALENEMALKFAEHDMPVQLEMTRRGHLTEALASLEKMEATSSKLKESIAKIQYKMQGSTGEFTDQPPMTSPEMPKSLAKESDMKTAIGNIPPEVQSQSNLDEINKELSKKNITESARKILEEEREKIVSSMNVKQSITPSIAGGFDQKDIDYWSSVVQKGGSLPPRLANTPGGKQLVAAIMKNISRGDVTPEQMLSNQALLMGTKAGERTMGTRTANAAMAIAEANLMADLVIDASSRVPRTNFIPINKVLLAYRTNSGNPEVREFGAAINSFINTYARAINPSGVGTVSAADHAREMLSSADSHEAVKAIIKQLKLEMEAARASPVIAGEELRARMLGKKAEPQAKTVNWSDLK